MPLALRNLIGVERLICRFVIRRIFVETGHGRAGAAPDHRKMALQGRTQRLEAAGKPAPIDRHHKPDRRPLRGRRLIPSSGDIGLHCRIEFPLVRGHLDEAIIDLSLRDRGREHAGLEIAAQQRARMA